MEYRHRVAVKVFCYSKNCQMFLLCFMRLSWKTKTDFIMAKIAVAPTFIVFDRIGQMGAV